MLRLGVITDLHNADPSTPGGAWLNPYDHAGTLDRLRAALEAFRTARVDAVAMLGDLTDDGRRAQFEPAVELLADCGLPVQAIPGNHDVQQPDGFETATAVLRRPAADANTLATVSLDGLWPGELVPRLHPGGVVDGAPAVVLSHHPVVSRAQRLAEAGLKYAGDLPQRPRLQTEVATLSAHVLVLCGHLHVRDAVAQDGLLQLNCAAQIEYPHEAAVVEVERGLVRRRCFAVGPHPPGHMADPLLVAAEQAWRAVAGGWVELAP